jgi:hypothetical protein
MSIPTAVFLDTSVLVGQSFNFSSTAISTFVPAFKNCKLKLLLPDPTEREIKRHMADTAEEAIGYVEKARRTAPFLAKVKAFPQGETDKTDVARSTVNAWKQFLHQFEVIRLNYDGIKLAQVMNWYDANEPPFDKAKKRKEFPDAFAIAILAAYAEEHTCYIAVVSHDSDLKKACDRFPSLMYFQSLPVLTELLLAEEDGRIATFRAALDTAAAAEKIALAAYGQTTYLTFYHRDSYSHIDWSEVSDLSITDMRIVALGEHECTIAFDAVIDVQHRVEWSEPGPDRETYYNHDTVTTNYEVSGTAKVSFHAKTNEVIGVPYVSITEEEIVVDPSDIPPYRGQWH